MPTKRIPNRRTLLGSRLLWAGDLEYTRTAKIVLHMWSVGQSPPLAEN